MKYIFVIIYFKHVRHFRHLLYLKLAYPGSKFLRQSAEVTG
jgi:hypothetical protein